MREKRIRKSITLPQKAWDRLADMQATLNAQRDETRYAHVTMSDLIETFVMQSETPVIDENERGH